MHTIKTMMKQHKVVLVAIVLAAAIALTAFASAQTARAKSSSASTASNKTLTAKAELASGAKAQTSKKGDAISKAETVYVKADATGTRTATYVSDWLQNAGNETALTDVSNLSNIQNVKGHEKYTKNGNTLTWKTKGKDIYYRGETDAALPVNVQVSYELNGESVSPKELAGKSGDVKITFTYNNESETDGITTPFTCATALDLPTSRFTDIKVTNGAVLSDGNNNIVVGVGFPGLKQDLGLENVDQVKIPESFTVEATVKNFKMGNTLTSISTDVLNRAGLKDIKSFKDLDNAINQLENASGKLVAGSLAARNGSAALQTGAASLNTGIGSLQSGLNQYTAGVASAANGGTTLATGSLSLYNGINSLYNQVPTLTSGIGQLYQGSQQLTAAYGDTKTDNTILNGSNSLATGAAQLNAGINDVKDANGNIVRVGLVNSIKGMNQQLQAVDASKVNTVLSNYQANLKQEGESAKNLAAVAQGLAAKGDVENAQKVGAEAKTLGAKAQSDAAALQDAQSSLKVLQNLGTMQTQLADACKDGGTLDQLAAGSSQLTTGSAKLNAALTKVAQGTKDLNDGLKQLNDSTGSLKDGVSQLNSGSKKLADGSKELSDGLNTLKANNNTLNSGAAQLASGSSQLYAGTVSLTSGLNTLYYGMNRFKTVGIDKIASVYNNNFKDLANKLNTIKKASADYNNFSGIASGMGGSVNFVIETDSISK